MCRLNAKSKKSKGKAKGHKSNDEELGSHEDPSAVQIAPEPEDWDDGGPEGRFQHDKYWGKSLPDSSKNTKC